MAQFVMCAALSWLVVTLLFAMDPSRAWKPLARRHFVRRVAHNIMTLASLFIVVGVIVGMGYLLAYRRLAGIRSSLENWWDQFTELWFAQCLLGIAFGAILAVWLRRAYRLPPSSDLSLSQKVEGIALVLLFIVGTTSTPLAELLRGASINTGFLNVTLAAATTRSDDARKGNNWAPLTFGPRGAHRPADEEFGLRTVADLHIHMKTDASRIEMDWQTAGRYPELSRVPGPDRVLVLTERLETAADTYRNNVYALTECIRFLNEQTGDRGFGRSLLMGLKPEVAKLHYLSLARMSQPSPENQFVDEVDETARNLATKLHQAIDVAADQAGVLETLRPKKSNGHCSGAVTPYSAADLFNILAERRPYISILYAALLQLDNQELTGVAVLDQWLEAFERYKMDHEEPAFLWFKLRIHATEYLLFESLFRREPAQRQTDLDSHLKNTELLINLYGTLPPVQEYYEKIFGNDRIELIADGFETEPAYRPQCPGGLPRDALTLSLGLLSSKAVYARRATQHSDFARNYIPQTRAYAEQVVNADYGCLARQYPQQFVLQTRAENLRVLALHRLASIGSRRAARSEYAAWVVRELKSAEAALKLSRTLLGPLDSTDAKETRDEVEKLLLDLDVELSWRDR
ncbi:hypothetical protein KEU06_20295 [Pseudaminobacter sp. 19-2017]|uniref:Uncharacterized protein n=1 Tax=Pseudaminobacter soli (ex Zhang et al. 2022) TaxID=2831468 RepID=A0A942I3V8_9HYPH|nr:hypothetical protein [Pseudaminobacter soli]MBS3650958.1 hypothetical protein [Pseudaminobacter soli]